MTEFCDDSVSRNITTGCPLVMESHGI